MEDREAEIEKSAEEDDVAAVRHPRHAQSGNNFKYCNENTCN